MPAASAADGLDSSLRPAWADAALQALGFPDGWTAWSKRHAASSKKADRESESQTGPQTAAAWLKHARTILDAHLIEPAWEPCWKGPPRLLEQRTNYGLWSRPARLGPWRDSAVWLLLPDDHPLTGKHNTSSANKTYPAALLLHDHGACFDIGKEKLIMPPAGELCRALADSWIRQNYGGMYWGDELAARGWVVMAVDALGWGDRAGGAYEGQQAIASNLFNLGSSWAGLIAREDQSALRLLAGMENIDQERLLVFGHSMGGFRAAQLGALTSLQPIIAAACFLNPLAAAIQPGANRTRGQSAFAMTHPGLSRHLDFADIAALCAPRRLCLINGSDDRLFPLDGFRQAVRPVVNLYRNLACENNFATRIHQGGHFVDKTDFEWILTQMGVPVSASPLLP